MRSTRRQRSEKCRSNWSRSILGDFATRDSTVTQERASAAYPLVSNQSTVAKAERAPSTEVGQTTMTWSARSKIARRSEEHTSELQSRENLVCRLLLDKKKTKNT